MEHEKKPEWMQWLGGRGFFPFYLELLNVERVNRDLLTSHRVENHILPQGFRYIFKEEKSWGFFSAGNKEGSKWLLLACEEGHLVAAAGVLLPVSSYDPQKS